MKLLQDVILPNRFELQLKAIDYMNLDIVGSHVIEFDDDSNKYLSIRKVPTTHSKIKHAIKFRSPFNHPTVMFKKSAVLYAGNYQNLKFREDYLLWINMINTNSKAANIDKILVEMRVNNTFYKRRSGFINFKSETILQKKLLSYKMINRFEYLRNIIIRGFGTFTPAALRKIIYNLFFRNKISKKTKVIYSNKYLIRKKINKEVTELYAEKKYHI